MVKAIIVTLLASSTALAAGAAKRVLRATLIAKGGKGVAGFVNLPKLKPNTKMRISLDPNGPTGIRGEGTYKAKFGHRTWVGEYLVKSGKPVSSSLLGARDTSD
jgi:hypothetical protein